MSAKGLHMEEGISESTWLVLVLKTKCCNDAEREQIKSSLLANFKLRADEVYYVHEEDCHAFCNFLFVKEHDEGDLRKYLEFRRDAFEPYPNHMRITGSELDSMVEGIRKNRRTVCVKHGDVVLIKNGRYSKLYGIVLRESRTAKVEVGLKFCFGVMVEQYNPDELEIVGNLFNYLKVLK